MLDKEIEDIVENLVTKIGKVRRGRAVKASIAWFRASAVSCQG